MAVWVPDVKAAFDPRRSIAENLSATIASSGVDAAIQQYHDLKAQDLRAHDLKAARPTTYNFDENELNSLGYRLLNAKKFKDAIRILQLNAEAYPQSSNVYDSLGEAYMDDGNKPLAIANYRKSVQLNPKNRNAVVYLQKLNAQ